MDSLINNKVTQYLYLPQMWYGIEKSSKETKNKMTELFSLFGQQQIGTDDIVQTPTAAFGVQHRGSKSIVERLGFEQDIPPDMRQKFEEHEAQLQKQRVLWVDYLKRVHPTVDNISLLDSLEKTKQAKELARGGIPDDMRGILWQQYSGSRRKYKSNLLTYRELLNANDGTSPAIQQIERDLNRTFPGNEHFQKEEGIAMLRRVLIAYAIWDNKVGYCQSMNFIVALLLLYMKEEEAFWMLVTIIEDLLPPEYYSGNMLGVNVDTAVFKALIAEKLPRIHQHFQRLDCEISHMVVQFFLCIFINTLPLEVTLRVWDSFVFEGGKILFRVGLALFHLHERIILQAKSSSEVYEILQRDLGNDPEVVTKLMIASFDKFWIGGFSMNKIKALRIQFKPEILADIELVEERRLTRLMKRQKEEEERKAMKEKKEKELLPPPVPPRASRSSSIGGMIKIDANISVSPPTSPTPIRLPPLCPITNSTSPPPTPVAPQDSKITPPRSITPPPTIGVTAAPPPSVPSPTSQPQPPPSQATVAPQVDNTEPKGRFRARSWLIHQNQIGEAAVFEDYYSRQKQ
eukprot:TRINITY_DN10709_c0_g1_i2.p1 TRINITY_DN10709_c0_g1~~TRINITY_DN10709_c0_g1_i2.p1  ORF type:complete len:573 (-),score=147.47 TRINITY_DN10709_c0_g1_i2:39-1757(-)